MANRATSSLANCFVRMEMRRFASFLRSALNLVAEVGYKYSPLSAAGELSAIWTFVFGRISKQKQNNRPLKLSREILTREFSGYSLRSLFGIAPRNSQPLTSKEAQANETALDSNCILLLVFHLLRSVRNNSYQAAR
jgi:hypothetical protein